MIMGFTLILAFTSVFATNSNICTSMFVPHFSANEVSNSAPSPIRDYKKMLKMFKEYTELAFKIAEDKIINDEEVIALKKFENKMTNFETKMTAKYENDEKATEKFNIFEEKNSEKLETLYNVFYGAMLDLYECEGSEKLGN